MNNKRIEFLCGKKKGGRDAKGVKALDTKQIEEFIKNEAPQNVKNYYSTLQKKNRGRVQLCKVLARFKKGQDLLKSGGTPSPKRKTPPSEQDPMAIMARSNFELMTQLGRVDRRASNNSVVSNRSSNSNVGNNNNENGEVYGYGSANSNGGNAAASRAFRVNYERLKRAEPDPFAKEVKLKGRNKAVIERKIRQLERKGQLPKAATRANLLKQLTLKTPAQLKALRGPPRRRVKSAKRASSASRAAAKRRIASAGFNARNRTPPSPGGFLKFSKVKNNATSRIPTRSKPVLSKGKKYSPSQIRAARREADKVLNKLNKAGLLPNMENGSPAYKKEMEKLKKELLNVQLVALPPSKPKSPVKPSFSFPSTQLGLKKELAAYKAMPAKNKTSQNKRIQRILQKIENFNKTYGRRAREAALGSARLPNVGSPNREGNQKEKNVEALVAKYSVIANAARARAGGSQKPAKRRTPTPPKTKVEEAPVRNVINVNELQEKIAKGKATSAERKKWNVMKAVARNMGKGRSPEMVAPGPSFNLSRVLEGMKEMKGLPAENARRMRMQANRNKVTVRGVGRGAKGWYSHGM